MAEEEEETEEEEYDEERKLNEVQVSESKWPGKEEEWGKNKECTWRHFMVDE